jgi:5S rRNA maturation endonuclease (ribonuclease M5)
MLCHASLIASALCFGMTRNSSVGRDLAKANDVVFIYHNCIDAVGDKRDTEHRTCIAVESALEEIVKLLKKAAAMNVSHFVITADHGFLFQNDALDESDFLAVPQPGEALQYQRRFIVAPKIAEDSRLKHFTATQLGLVGNLQFAFPKGIQRLRLQGSGSRYVHGGTSLQEIVVPVVEVKKLRIDDVAQVEVDNRIAIPIHNPKGEVVAYAGRFPGEPGEDNPKYKLPQGFRKSQELFNIDRAIKESGSLFIVEGFFDAMKLHQHGCRKVVAIMGSTLSAAQEELIRQHTNSQSHVIVMLDENEAGKVGREDIACRLSKFCFVRVHQFDQPDMEPEHLTQEEVQQLMQADSPR